MPMGIDLMSASYLVMVDETNTIIGIQGFARNINDRKNRRTKSPSSH
jgi:hypothetical protein